MQFEIGRKKHPGRESSAALIVPSDVRSALFSRNAYYSCSVSPGSWNTAPAWGWSWRGLCREVVLWLFPPRGTSHQSQQWCLVPAFDTPPRAGWVIFYPWCSSFATIWQMWGLSSACPEGAASSDVPEGGPAQELLAPDVSRQPLCLHSVFTACLGSQLCQIPVVQFVHLALPFPSRLNGSEDEKDSAPGLLSGFSVLSPPLSWRVLLKILM